MIKIHYKKRKQAFTLVELLVALAITASALAVAFSSFYALVKAWQRGLIMTDNMNHAEFVMEEIVCALRSAFYPVRSQQQANRAASTNAPGETNVQEEVVTPTTTFFGFILEDNGSGENARDSISWVKTGISLLPEGSQLAQGLHRVFLTLEEDKDHRLCVASRAWRPYGISSSFDPYEIKPRFISAKVTGMNVRVAKELKVSGGWDWLDEWSDDNTNHLPLAVEITIFMEPLSEGEEAISVTRTVELPVAPWSWKDKESRPDHR